MYQYHFKKLIYPSYNGLSRMVGIKQFKGVYTCTFSNTKSISLALTILVFLTISIFLIPKESLAQGMSYGYSYVISDTDAVSGDIIARSPDNTYIRANLELSNFLVGVLSSDLTILYEEEEGVGSPVAVGGTATVNVTTLNGPISPGDYIIASGIQGKGQKSPSPNVVTLGIALGSFSETDGTPQDYEGKQLRFGSVPVAIQIKPLGTTQAGAITNLIDQVGNLFFQTSQAPEQANILFRYIAAAIVAATSVAISFRAFGGSISNGIEAMGRNPLARRQIQATILINAGLILIISFAGLGLAYAILRL